MATEVAAPETPPAVPPADERIRQRSLLTRILVRPEIGAVIAAVVVWVFFAIVAYDNNFVSWGSTASILNTAAPLGILAVAVTLLMIAGEFDLSIGSILGFAGMTIMVLVTPESGGGFGWNLWPAIGAALIVSVLVGLLNGALVMWTRLPSFIITLATLFIFRGLALALSRYFTNRTQLGGLDEVSGFEPARAIFASNVRVGTGQFNIAILWWIGLVVLASWVLLRTRPGNWIFGAGGDANAARNVGVPVTRLKITLFVVTALAGCLVAVIQAVQFTGSDALRGTGQEFEAIIAAVVGGTLLTGGYGSAVGAGLGAFIFAMVQQGIRITGIQGDWYQVFVGTILVAAVIFNNFVRQKAQKR